MAMAPACASAGSAPTRATQPGRVTAMGLSAGGKMQQKVYPDPHGIETWDQDRSARLFVHIVNSEQWREITGRDAPSSPVTAREYERAGLPWFDLYDEGYGSLAAPNTLKEVKSVKQIDQARSSVPLQDDEPVEPGNQVHLAVPSTIKPGVRDGEW